MHPASRLLLVALAIAPLPAVTPGTTPSRGNVATSVASRLRQLVTAQEQYYGEHGTYTTDGAALGVFQPRTQPIDSIYLQVGFAGGRGWNDVARHRGYPGRTCVIVIGSLAELPIAPTTAGGIRATEEGLPTCDEF